MAIHEQLTRLQQNGREKWNIWREEHPEEKVDLSGADLSRADLNEANLSEANLNGAHLSGAYLIGAHLSGAFLNDADLSGAKLSGADLHGADLSEANLNGAFLSGAFLGNADLSGAHLSGAHLSGAHLSGANLGRPNVFKAIFQGRDLSHKDLNGADLSRAFLSGAFLGNADLSDADLSGAHLSRAHLSGANLSGANLSRANLSGANLSGANLSGANLSGANLSGANLSGANLSRANLSRANLSRANLSKTLLIETNFTRAILTDCTIYGIAAWGLQLEDTIQTNLIINPPDQSTITVDNIEVAQFIYLLLNNAKIRDVINTLTTKSVLILGRFTPERKVILEALRETIRKQNYLPILFDFEQPKDRNLTETVTTLAHLARFIIADLTEPSSIPQELQAIIPTLAIPVQPILRKNEREYAMFPDFHLYHWVLPTYIYKDQSVLLASIENEIIQPAEQKARELEESKQK